jgi:hypothetical protein
MEDEVKVELGRKPMDRLDDFLEEAYAMKAAPAILTNLTAVQKKNKKIHTINSCTTTNTASMHWITKASTHRN